MNQLGLFNTENKSIVLENGWIEYTDAYDELNRLYGLNIEIKKHDSKRLTGEVYSLNRYNEAVKSGDYSRVTNQNLAYLYLLVYEGYYGEKSYSVPVQEYTRLIGKFIQITGCTKESFLDKVTSMIENYDSLGYSSEKFPYLTMRMLATEFIAKRLFDGKPKKTQNFSRNKADSETYWKKDYEELKREQETNPELYAKVDDEY